MPFDMNSLFDNPGFVFGASLLANGRQPGAVGNAFGLAQKINEFKANKAIQQQQQAMMQKHYDATSRYQDALTSNANEELKLRREQGDINADLTRQKLAQAQRQAYMQELFMRQLGPAMGLDLSGMPPMAKPEADNEDGAQGNSAAYNIPQGGQLNTPPIGGMPGENPYIAGGARFDRALPAMGDKGQPAPVQNFNPDAMDPAGPFAKRGGFGAPGLGSGSRARRPMLRAGSGTPPQLLDNLERVESSGNPNAVNPQSGAMGAYQFMPQTVQMLNSPPHNLGFNPFNRDESRAAADYYISRILAPKRGGDLQAALADYGGFKTKDPTGYTARVLKGVEQPPAAASGIQAPPMSNANGLRMAQLGAMGALMGVPGAASMVQLGQMMKPESVAAGSYMRDPQTGVTQFVGDPYREHQQKNDDQRLALEQYAKQLDAQRLGLEGTRVGLAARSQANEDVKTQRTIAKDDRELAAARATDANHLNAINTNMDRMASAASGLLKDPGLSMNAGFAGALHLNRIPGTKGRDTATRIETLKNKLVVDTMTALKEASQTGSTGFGQLSEREGTRLETMIANLDNAQSEASLRKQLQAIVQFSKESKAAARQRYNSIYGQQGGSAATPSPQPAPQQAGPMSLDDYIAKHKR